MPQRQAPPSLQALATQALICVAAAAGSSADVSTTSINCPGVPLSRGMLATASLDAGDGIELEVAGGLLGAVAVERFGCALLLLLPVLYLCLTIRTPMCRATTLSGGTSTAANPFASMVIAAQDVALSDLMMLQ